jgi:hypothetical protein
MRRSPAHSFAPFAAHVNCLLLLLIAYTCPQRLHTRRAAPAPRLLSRPLQRLSLQHNRSFKADATEQRVQPSAAHLGVSFLRVVCAQAFSRDFQRLRWLSEVGCSSQHHLGVCVPGAAAHAIGPGTRPLRFPHTHFVTFCAGSTLNHAAHLPPPALPHLLTPWRPSGVAAPPRQRRSLRHM